MALGAFSTEAAMMAPCFVKTPGRVRAPPQDLEVAACDLKLRVSSAVNRNMKSAGNPADVAPHLLVEALCLNAVKRGQVVVDEYSVPTDEEDGALDALHGNHAMLGHRSTPRHRRPSHRRIGS
ncbi:MAG TPA: hypothetical protein VMK12_19305 [Anaeromyxobacteraceae bacterium]|nr:hypothetical protein [Anaeromyxobacteraceae bacterium]